jgi:hypothetical protein
MLVCNQAMRGQVAQLTVAKAAVDIAVAIALVIPPPLTLRRRWDATATVTAVVAVAARWRAAVHRDVSARQDRSDDEVR